MTSYFYDPDTGAEYMHYQAEPRCNGICMTGYDVGVPYNGIAYAHPECELHGYVFEWPDPIHAKAANEHTLDKLVDAYFHGLLDEPLNTSPYPQHEG